MLLIVRSPEMPSWY